MKNIKFTMELVWHSCLEYLPEESYNDCLFLTDGVNVFPVIYDSLLGWFDIVNKSYININIVNCYWADIEQTIQGDERFKSQNETY